jgi:hypothetical protein
LVPAKSNTLTVKSTLTRLGRLIILLLPLLNPHINIRPQTHTRNHPRHPPHPHLPQHLDILRDIIRKETRNTLDRKPVAPQPQMPFRDLSWPPCGGGLRDGEGGLRVGAEGVACAVEGCGLAGWGCLGGASWGSALGEGVCHCCADEVSDFILGRGWLGWVLD